MSARKTRAAERAAAPRTKAGAEIREHRLRNGLRVLLVERHLDPVVAVMVWYGVGSRDEREHEAGASHFLEHMMFKGTRAVGKGEVDRLTTELGGSNNAFTTSDHTAYWFELASDRWEAALEIEADRMRGLLLDPAEFEAEKAVILEELAMGLDDPWRNLSMQVQEMLFPRHPYRRPVIGYRDVLEALAPEDLRDYYRRFYHPANATLVICGDIGSAAALRAVRKHFGGIAAGPTETRRRAAPAGSVIEEPRGERRIQTSWDDAGKRLCLAWPTIAVSEPEDFVLDVLSAILSTGRLSRLHRRLVLERSLATSMGTNNDTRVDGGSFWLFAECAPDVEPEALERAIDAELAELAAKLPAAKELKRAKATLASSEAYEGETVSDLAESLGAWAVDAHWHLALEAAERRNAVSAKDVRDAARRFLRSDRRVVGWSLPRTGAQS
ncbi:MAG: insulinase family protein [Planctomycetota bacterium]|nr:MAG: insulinase family protein [Planctomycetota bacterium]